MAELKYLDGTGLSQVWAKIKSLLSGKADKTVTDGLANDLSKLSDTVDTKANKSTTLAGYGITDAYTKTEVDGKLTSAMHYKGTVAIVDALPANAALGDMYNVEADGNNYAWNGTDWDKMAGTIDLSSYYTKTETDTKLGTKVDKVTGKQLSTNDYTAEDKQKLAGIAPGAQVNIIEKINVNGVAATITNKEASVTITMPPNMVALTTAEIDAIIA